MWLPDIPYTQGRGQILGDGQRNLYLKTMQKKQEGTPCDGFRINGCAAGYAQGFKRYSESPGAAHERARDLVLDA